MRPTRALAAAAAILSGAIAVVAQDRLTNAPVETRSAVQGLESEVRAIAARGSSWIAYKVPIAGRFDHMCDGDMRRSALYLEPATELVLFAKLEGGAVVRIRTATPDCDVDAGGSPVVRLTGVRPDDSVSWLASFVKTAGGGADRVTRPALRALALHDSALALRILVDTARDHPVPRLRSDALFWMAERAGRQALATISTAIDADPDLEVKKKAVFALSQLPKDEGVPRLIEVARTHKSPAVRKQAMFWLGQSNDPRALEFFAQILGK